MHDIEDLRISLTDLGLLKAAELLDPLLEKAARDQPSYLEFISDLINLEKQARRQRSEETRFKLSRLPHRKTLDEFDFSFQPNIDKRQINELSTMAFAARHENVILLGPPGVCVFRRHPDNDTGIIRTAYRNYPDTVSELSGHLVELTN